MINCRIVERPAFHIAGKKTWISGQDNAIFGRFWDKCGADGLFEVLKQINDSKPGPHTGGVTLGVSRVERDPAKREFYYMIAVENPHASEVAGLELYEVPATQWAVFECHGKVPESIVKAEMVAFMEWLPNSDYVHANAPEMEVYPPGSDGSSEDNYCEFWLPVKEKGV